MGENNLVKYSRGELARLSNSFSIINKLLAIEKRKNLFDYFHLPIKTIYYDLNLEHRNYYDDLKKVIKKKVFSSIADKGFEDSRLQIAQGIYKLRLACFLTSTNDEKTTPNKSIFSQVLINELLIRKHLKVFIVSPFVDILDHLSILLSQNGLNSLQLDGKTTNRDFILSSFNKHNSNFNILLASKNSINGININTDSICFLNTDGYINTLYYIVTRDRNNYCVPIKKFKKECIAFICRNTIEENLIILQKKYDSPNLASLIAVEDLKYLFE